MTYDYRWLTEFPYWSLDDAMDAVTSEYPKAWLDYWGIGDPQAPDHLDPDDWSTANEMHDLARRICVAAGALQGGLPDHIRTLPPVLTRESQDERKSRREMVDLMKAQDVSDRVDMAEWNQVIKWLEWHEGPAEAREKLFRAAVEIYAYEEFGSSPAGLRMRLLELLGYLVRASEDRTREYLKRVATCYIRQMDPEMAIMSRAVMESALHFPQLEERVEVVINAKGKRHPGLVDWIEAAKGLRVVNPEGYSAAKVVKNAGDDAVHNIPVSIPKSPEILSNLSLVLGQIERFRQKHENQ